MGRLLLCLLLLAAPCARGAQPTTVTSLSERAGDAAAQAALAAGAPPSNVAAVNRTTHAQGGLCARLIEILSCGSSIAVLARARGTRHRLTFATCMSHSPSATHRCCGTLVPRHQVSGILMRRRIAPHQLGKWALQKPCSYSISPTWHDLAAIWMILLPCVLNWATSTYVATYILRACIIATTSIIAPRAHSLCRPLHLTATKA